MSWQMQLGSLLRWSKTDHARRRRKPGLFGGRPLRLEPLENRTLLSIDTNLVGGVLYVVDNVGAANDLTLSGDAVAGFIEVNDTVGVAPLDPLNPALTVLNPNTVRYAAAGLTQIIVRAGAFDDKLTLDFANGNPIPPGAGGLDYDGGTGSNSLKLINGTETSDVYTPGPTLGAGKIDITAGAVEGGKRLGTMHFENLSPVLDIVPGPAVVNGTPANNAVNYTQGSVSANGLVTVDNFESYEFSNKTTLTINGLAGSDEINLNNPHTPTGLTAIFANGNDPTASDRLIINGTAGIQDALFVQPTAQGAGTVTSTSFFLPPPPISFTGIEDLRLVGQLSEGDTFGVGGTTGDDVFEYNVGTAPDMATVTGLMNQSTAAAFPLVPITFSGMATSAAREFNTRTTGGSDTFSFEGTARDDDLLISQVAGGALEVKDSLAGQGFGFVKLGNFAAVTVDGLGGNDSFTFDTTGAAAVSPPVVNLHGGDSDASSDVLTYKALPGVLPTIDYGLSRITCPGALDVTFSGIEKIVAPPANTGNDLQAIDLEFKAFVAEGGRPEDFVSQRAADFLFDHGKIYVELRTNADVGTYAAAVRALGFQVRASSPQGGVLEGFLPLAQLEVVAAMRGTVSVLPVWFSNQTDSQGTVANQAETVLHTNFLSGLFDVDGSGVTVGVISDSANLVGGGLSASQSSGNLPPLVPVLIDGLTGIDEGRAMMELIHDIAPGAQLVFASGGGSDAAMGAAIDALVAAHANIIVDDLNGLSTEPYYQDGIAAQAVNRAVAAGVTYFSSAGNRGPGGYDTPANFAGAAAVNGINANWHDFDLGAGADRLLRITIPAGTSRFIFQYDQPFGSVTSDLDIRVFSPAGVLLGSGLDVNTATQVPREIFTVNNASGAPMPVDVAVNLAAGTAPTRFKFIVFGGAPATIDEHQNEPGALVAGHNPAHGGTGNSISVAAAPFSNATTAEAFTGQGPVTRTLSPQGTAVPLQTINRAIITSVDGTSTSVPGFGSFFGTSAAAPNAAAVAALLLDLKPNLSPNQLRNVLVSRARDIGAPGFDFVTGFGLIDPLSSALLVTGGVLTISGDRDGANQDDTFLVAADASDANLVDVTLNGALLGSFDRTAVSQLDILGLGGNDTLTVDSTNGLVRIPGGIRFDGGMGFDRLRLVQTGGTAQTSDVYSVGPDAGEGSSVITGPGGIQTVYFQNLAPVYDLVPAASVTVNGTPAANAINYRASTDPLNPGGGTVTVDNFERLEFDNKDQLIIDAQAGSDEINLNNPNPRSPLPPKQPSGSAPGTFLSTITVNGDDPTASDRLVVNGTTGAETINYAPTGPQSGDVTFPTGSLPPVHFTTVEEVAINGQGGGDTLIYTSPTNTLAGSAMLYTPGASPDAGSITGHQLPGGLLTPLTFTDLGTTVGGTPGIVRFDTANPPPLPAPRPRTDVLDINGTPHSDVFKGTTPDGGTVQIVSAPAPGSPVTGLIQTPAIKTLGLHGLDGDDTFNLAATLPYTSTVIDGGDPSASDTINLTGATGPVTVNIADSALPTPTNTTITGYGTLPTDTVTLIGVEVANLNINGNALTAVGTSRDDVITYTPTGASAGTFQAAGVNTIFNFTDVTGTFTVQGGTGGNADELVVQGTNARDLFRIDQSLGTVQVLANNVNALQSVQLGDTVEVLTALGLAGEDTFQVKPGVGIAPFPLDNLLVNVDGGDPESSDALVVVGSFGPPVTQVTDFVVVNRGRDPNSGTVRVFAGGITQFPDINYKNVETVSPLVGSTAGNPNLLIMGPDLFEPDDFQGNAAFLGSGATLQIQHATIFPNSTQTVGPPDGNNSVTILENPGVPADQDYYRVVAQNTGTLDFQVYFKIYAGLPEGGNLALEVLDAAGSVIGHTATLPLPPPPSFGTVGTTANARVRIPAVAGQSYYLHVFGANLDGTHNPAVINGYDATIINTPPPVPTNLELSRSVPPPIAGNPDTGDLPASAPGDDTGRSQFDNVTRFNNPTIFVRLDDAGLLQDLPGNQTSGGVPPMTAIRIPFNTDTTIATTTAGFRIALFDGGNGAPAAGVVHTLDPNDPTFIGFAQPVVSVPPTVPPTVPHLYSLKIGSQGPLPPGVADSLADGLHHLTARVQLIDPATPTKQTGFGDRSASLDIIVDTAPPPVFFGSAQISNSGLDPSSDSGVQSFPPTFTDRATNVTRPSFFGRAEANAIIRAFVDVDGNPATTADDIAIGQTVAIPLDGTNAFPNGQWNLTSTVDLNDPSLPLPNFSHDGTRHIIVTAEDLAGNVSGVQTLNIFIDTQGPQISNVQITGPFGAPLPFNLFGLKPGNIAEGPTPLVNSLTISVVDQPPREPANFPNYVALLADAAQKPGVFVLKGDSNGIIPIANVIVVNTLMNDEPATATIQLVFFSPLPDDRYTLTINDADVVDPAGNKLDGESNAQEPNGAPTFPSGNGEPGGDFIARFTVDSRPEIGAWAAGSVYVDINGNFTYDPTNPDFVNRDLTFAAGFASDHIFAGKFNSTTTGFDTLAAYGKDSSGNFRWLIDTDGNGVLDEPPILEPSRIIGMPVAGDFNGNPNDGDEVGLFNGTTWFLDTDRNFQVDRQINVSGMSGLPIVGDFDGDGRFDLATYQINPVNKFFFALAANGYAVLPTTTINAANQFGFIGVRARPVAADMDQDGITDVGLWVPDRAGATEEHVGEWYFLISNSFGFDAAPAATPGSVSSLDHAFSPTPLGHDLFARFGNEFAVPVVGNFDPPVGSHTGIAARTATPSSIGVFSGGSWYLDANRDQTWNSADGKPRVFGWDGATSVVGDWNGDGKKEIGAYANGAWWLDTNGNGAYDTSDAFFYYGWQGATPVVGDWNGDGTDDVGVYNLGAWFRDVNANKRWDGPDQAALTYYGWGGATPVVGDWNGDGTDDVGVYNLGAWFRDVNANNHWDSTDQAALTYYGWSGPTPVVGDWNGDGTDDVGVYNQGTWLRDVNGNGQWDGPDQAAVAHLGWSGAQPVVGNWTTPGSPLLAAGGPVAGSPNTQTLSQAALQPIVAEAFARWAAAGASAGTLAAMKQVQFAVADLPGSYLGLAEANRIYLDRDAAGHGWFIDPTPAGDEEFVPSGGQRQLRAIDPRAVDRIDLLSVVEHELGHLAGLRDVESALSDIMSEDLQSGIRRTPQKADAEALWAGARW